MHFIVFDLASKRPQILVHYLIVKMGNQIEHDKYNAHPAFDHGHFSIELVFTDDPFCHRSCCFIEAVVISMDCPSPFLHSFLQMTSFITATSSHAFAFHPS